MKQRRRIVAWVLSLLATVAVFFGSTSLAYAADGDYPVPETSKELIDNEDGTYTLKLSVTGSAKTETTTPKANVIFIMDRSGSMNENTNTAGYKSATYGDYGKSGDSYVDLYFRYNGNYYRCRDYNYNADTVYTLSGDTYTQYTGSRYDYDNNLQRDDIAITAAQELASNLMSYNTASSPDTVELAFVSFNDTATNGNSGNWTTSASTARSTIAGYTGQNNTGTNWEDALIHAEALAAAKKAAQPDVPLYVIFLTDGNPTRYINAAGNMAGNGQETTANINTCYNEAAPHELAMTNAGYMIYNIGCFGNTDRMEDLTDNANTATASGHGTAEYYSASDSSALNAAFAEILASITNSLSLADVKFTDGVTDMTHSTGVNGTPDNFTYTMTVNGVEEPWPDAPAATVNANKEVIWNLSKDKDGNDLVIADGVTVTCSFIVWPDQDAMDLIADLNNNKVSYDSLTPEQKSQIQGSEGNYSLKTNTECKLDYSVLENKDGDIQKIPQDPITLDPPDPMPLYIDKLSLEKKWEDSLDPEQKEEVEGEVKLDFYKDNEKYVLPGYEDGITLTEAENWVKENFLSIATGIMVSEESPAYNEQQYSTVTYNGKTYCILETGHDYHFQEQDINDHFELTAYTYHPMLVDGVLHNLTFEKDGSGNITGVTEGAEISTVSATNTIKGGVSITKKVVDEDGNEVDSDDPFTIVMHIQNPEEYDYRIYYGEKNPHYNDPEEGTENPSAEEMATNLQRHRSGHFIGTGSEVSVTIYQGDELRFVNVANGTEYYVDEDVTAGYTLDGITYQIHRVVDEEDVTGDYADDEKRVDGDTTWYIMQGNSSGVVEVTNTYKYGELDITKTVACDDAEKAESAKAQEFEFTVRLYADATKATELTSSEYAYTVWEDGAATSTTGTVKSGGIIKLKDGQTAKIEKLPEGAYYEVTEAAVQGYTTTKTGDTGNIVKNEAKTATFTNKYNYEDVYKPLTLTLNKVDANTGNKIDGAVFTLTKTDETTQDYTVTNGTVTIDFDKPGKYTLVEKTAPDGYDKLEGTWTIEVQKDTSKTPEVTYKEDKNVFEWLYDLIFGDVTKDPADGWTYNNGILTVENPPTTTEVVATKVWDDNSDQDGVRPDSVTFQLYKTVNGQTTAVKDADGNNVTAELSGKGDNTWTTTFKDLPAYEDGYKVTYSVMEMNASGAVVAEGGKLDDNYTASYGSDGLTVTNKHEIDKTKVTVTKNWNDNKNADKTRPESVSVTLSADGTAVGNAVTLNEGNKWTYTWENLDVNAAGKAITYTVDEAPVDGYAKSISDISGSATAGYSYTITNSNVTVDTNTTAFFKKSVTTPNDVQDAVFEFKIEAVDGAPMPKDSTGAVVTTGTATYEKGTSGDKAIDFGKITYTAAGEYKYKITETNKPAGWTATPDKPVEVTVTVTGDAATGFNATVGGKTITNSYSANSVKTTLTATKKVYGKDAEGAFGFSLKLTKGDESGVTIPEGSATAATSDSIKKGGSEQVSFADIEFTKPGTYVFTVDETTEAPSDKWVYDASTHDITVKVTDDGAGALSAKVTGDNPAFYNTYEDDVKTVSAGTSTNNIDGQEVQAGQTLTYTINWTAAAGGETADVVVTDTIPANTTLKADSVSAGGTVSEDGKTITWAFPRQEPGATGTVSFQVTVDEAAAGTKLENTAVVRTGGNDATTNTTSNEVKKGGFKLSKVIVSTTGVTDETDEFTFEVSAKDSAGNDLKGTYDVTVAGEKTQKTFEGGKIEITLKGGQVAVIDGLPVGTTYTVTETDVPEGYELTAVNGEEGETEGSGKVTGAVSVDVIDFTFTNTYSATGKAGIPVSKTVTSATEGTKPGDWGFDFTIAAGTYEGEAKDVTVPLPEETTVTLSGSGNETVSDAFGAIEYAAAGTYTYTVTEKSAEGYENKGISTVGPKTVTVTVVDNGVDGELTATVKDADTAAAFENVYSVEATSIVLGASKHLEVKEPANNAPDVSGKYTFTLKEGDEVIDTTTNPDGDGTAVSFEKISYDKPGEHQYTVTETGEVEGVTNGQDSYTVKVNVSDQGDGTLKAEVTEGSQVTTFTNTYSVEPVTLDTTKQFNVTKDLSGTPLTAGAFKFTLTAGTNDADVATPMPENASATNDASGKVVFDTITYNKPGTYNYTISEVDGGVGGYTYDKNTVAVKVVVTDNGAGALVAEVSYDGSTTFVNTYEAKGEFAPTAQKLVEGHSLADEQFTFQLLDEDGKVIEETKNNDAGQVIFKAIQYTQDDFDDMATTEEDATDEATTDEAKPQKRTKTFKYTVREINDGQGGWTYDDHEAKYIVTVTDNGEGEMEISYEKDGEPTFINTYEATGKTGEGALAGTKTVPGTKLKDGQFSFQLKDSDGNVIETVSNDANGNFEFSALSYVKNSKKDETGEHTYSIVEVNDGQRGYTYDSHVCDVTVTVTDNDEGKLNVTVKLSDGKKAAFSNPYKPLATSAPVTAKKVLEGRDLKAGEFTFELRDAEGKVVATATNAASGLVDFGYVSFDEVGTYTFTATEVKGSDANVTYDSSTKTYTVEVVDDGGQLVATVTCDDPSATFTNVYKKPDVPGKPGKPKKKVVIPQTGDDTPTGAMAALTVFGAAALTAGTVLQRRKRK